MTDSSNTTRRGFLSTAAALAASAAVAIPANAFGADPIFEAIEVHKAARLAFENAVSRGSALDEELPSEKNPFLDYGLGTNDCRNGRSAMDRQRA